MIVAALLLSAAAVPPVPPPPSLEAADCEHPSYASDQLICSNESLLALDHQLRALLPVPAVAANVHFEDQMVWFKRSRMCASKAGQQSCLQAAYRERIAVLTALHSLSRQLPAWRPVKCGKRQSELADETHGVIALRWDGRIVLANAATELASWTPFAWIRRSGNKLEVRSLDGLKTRCDAPSR